MPESEGLLAFAEIAVALAGFSSIVILFRRDATGRWKRVHALAFRDMIGISLVAAFLAVLPFALTGLGLDLATAWAWLNGALGALALVAVPFAGSKVYPAATTTGERVMVLIGFGGTSAFALLLLLNAVGLVGGSASGLYVALMVWMLFVAGLLFVRLVAIPHDQVRD